VKELVNDFATEDFLTKNVRVRPVSSYSMADGKEPKNQTQTQEEEDEKKFNSEALYDMMQQRFEQKDRKKKEEQDRLLEAEKAEKKRRAKQ